MAKNRVRKKARRRRSSRQSSSSSSSSGRQRPDLTRQEMLDRVPVGKELLTTADVQYVFNDCHQQTIYKMIGRGELRPYKSRNRGKANVYKVDEVVQAIGERFQLTPGRRGSGGDSGDETEEAEIPREARAVPPAKGSKPKRGSRK